MSKEPSGSSSSSNTSGTAITRGVFSGGVPALLGNGEGETEAKISEVCPTGLESPPNDVPRAPAVDGSGLRSADGVTVCFPISPVVPRKLKRGFVVAFALVFVDLLDLAVAFGHSLLPCSQHDSSPLPSTPESAASAIAENIFLQNVGQHAALKLLSQNDTYDSAHARHTH
ncbi:hypothetical protein BWQ96_01284 [Gracilariopsis chorda]|uniref:Uncharacterized protein n=1 Tax=Gracilariopsis chorda TaxID=448386 RepID=A0A2V3J490_9FLOR|nr:hypothetical protein BWQ96_01284 [Gracilariopsis chorda]|eukprot:PXF48942.1 hypothetical protein BWQ96_01284 [Gracilariopsis chorda]